MNHRILKVPMSCRISPELKYELEEEAATAHLTASAYLESILLNRNNLPTDEDVDTEKYQQKLEEELYDISIKVQHYEDNVVPDFEAKIAALNKEIESLKKEKEAEFSNSKQIVDLTEQLEIQAEFAENLQEKMWLEFSSEETEKRESYLEKLAEKYPDADAKNLVLASLHAACKNEESLLFTYTPESYFKLQNA